MAVDKDVNLVATDSKPIMSDRSGSHKVTIAPAQHKTLTHLPKRPPVDLAFTDLTYKVQEGRKSSEYLFLVDPIFVAIISFVSFVVIRDRISQ